MGKNYQPQLVNAGFLNHQQYIYWSISRSSLLNEPNQTNDETFSFSSRSVCLCLVAFQDFAQLLKAILFHSQEPGGNPKIEQRRWFSNCRLKLNPHDLTFKHTNMVYQRDGEYVHFMHWNLTNSIWDHKSKSVILKDSLAPCVPLTCHDSATEEQFMRHKNGTLQ